MYINENFYYEREWQWKELIMHELTVSSHFG